MARVGYKNWAVDAAGAIVASAAVEVRQKSDDSLATLYTTVSGGTTKGNPFNAETDGSFEFFVEADRYDLLVGAGASQETIPLDLVDARNGLSFSTRDEFVTAVSGGYAAADGAVVFAGGLTYVAETGATAISDLAGWVPFGEIYPDHFAENVTQGVTDMTAAIQAMADAYGYLRFRPETYLVSDTITLSGLDIRGQGAESRILLNQDDRALFSVNTDGASYTKPEMRGVYLSCSTASTDVNSCALLFEGDENFVQRGTIAENYCNNFYSFIKSTKATRTTSFGEEGAVNHMTFEDNHLSTVFYGYWFTQGSGTGNVWRGNKSSVRNSGSVYRFGGTGDVVGDIAIIGAFPNTGGPGSATFFTVDSGTAYNANILINGCQLDSNIDTVFSIPAATIVKGLTYIGNSTGGNAVLNAPLVREAVIHDEESTEWIVGRADTTGTASGTIDAARVTLDTFSSVRILVSVSGLLQGTASCQSSAEFTVCDNSGSLTIELVEHNKAKSTCPDISITSHSTTEADIEVAYSAASSGSDLVTNISVVGGEFKVERL